MSWAGPARSQPVGRPNVILILSDDQGWGDLGAHGNKQIETPVLDRFAKEGLDFTRFYSSPVCAPTRASLLTGRYYYRTGVIHTSRGGAKMASDETTLAEVLENHGFATGIFGKWHLGDTYPMRPMDQGFQESLVHKSGGIGQTPDRPNSYQNPYLWQNGRRVPFEGYCTDIFFDAAIDFIKGRGSSPFFVYLPLNAPHTPLEIDPRYVEPFLEKGLNETTARVYGMIKNLDENVGKLVAYLETSQLRDETLVVFMGDNGPQQNRYNGGLSGRKASVYEGGIRSLFLLQAPGIVDATGHVSEPIAHIDVFPTILDWVGVQSDQLPLDGVSFVPLLKGEDSRRTKRELYFQCHRGLVPKLFQNAAVVGERYKLVLNPGTFSDESFRLVGDDIGKVALFDLLADPGEQNDLSGLEQGRVQGMLERYRAWFDEVKASRGFVPGRLVVGAKEENPVRLCRYQDGQFERGFSQGWPVELVRNGRYRVRVVLPDALEEGHLFLSWQGRTEWRWFSNSFAEAEFQMVAGNGLLDVWVQEDAGTRQRPGNNDIVGDVVFEWLTSPNSAN